MVIVVVTFEGDAMHFKVLQAGSSKLFFRCHAQTKACISIIESDQGRALRVAAVFPIALVNWSPILHTVGVCVSLWQAMAV